MTAEKILKIAEKEVGTREDSTGRVKYNIAYGLIDAWCVMFIWWVFREAGASKLFYNGKKVASCTKLFETWAIPEGLSVSVKDIRPGDLIIFQFGSNRHIGICKSVDNKYVTTIDGNTCEDGKEWDGYSVMIRKRSKNLIKWVIRPKYLPEIKKNNPAYHFVHSGNRTETFMHIATTYGLTYDELRALNPMIKDTNLLKPGQRIRVK